MSVRFSGTPCACCQRHVNCVARGALIAYLRLRGMLAVFHYLPPHLSAFGLRYGGHPGDCPVTEDVSNRLLRLPFYHSITDTEQARVVEVICQFRP